MPTRSLSRGWAGQNSITAAIPTEAARPHTDGLAGMFTGSTNVSIAAVPAAAK